MHGDPGVLVVAHAAGRFHLRSLEEPGQSALDLLRAVGRSPVVPGPSGAELGDPATVLDRYLCFADGRRLLTDLDEVVPKASFVVVSANKIAMPRGYRFPDPEMADVSCHGCEKAAPVVACWNGQPFCEACWLARYESDAFASIASQYDGGRPVVASVSGERDSTIAATVFMKYVAATGVTQPVRFLFIDNGNLGPNQYRRRCREMVEALAIRLGVPLTVWSIQRRLGVTLEMIGCAMQRAGYRDANPNICEHCTGLSSLLPSPPEFGGAAALSGYTLTDLVRDNILRGRFVGDGAFFTGDVKPLRNMTDGENSIYAALTDCHYFVGDCQFADIAYGYQGSAAAQLFEIVFPDRARVMANGIRSVTTDRLERDYVRIFDLWNGSGRPQKVFRGVRHCTVCGHIYYPEDIATIFSDTHLDCRPIADSDRLGEYVASQAHVAGILKESVPYPGSAGRAHARRDWSAEVTPFLRLPRSTRVAQRGRGILLHNVESDHTFAISEPTGWETKLLADLRCGWIGMSAILSAYVDGEGAPFGHVMHFLTSLSRVGFLEADNAPATEGDGSPAWTGPPSLLCIVDSAWCARGTARHRGVVRRQRSRTQDRRRRPRVVIRRGGAVVGPPVELV